MERLYCFNNTFYARINFYCMFAAGVFHRLATASPVQGRPFFFAGGYCFFCYFYNSCFHMLASAACSPGWPFIFALFVKIFLNPF
jgi:hypothetical protein